MIVEVMVSPRSKVVVAFVIALAGLALTAAGLVEKQILIAALGGLVTAMFVLTFAAIEKSTRQ